MEEYIHYITNIAVDGERPLRPVYGIVPTEPLEERVATDLAGFQGVGPVRVGNQAAEQLQHDAYGSVILAASQMFIDERLPRMGDADLFRRLEPLGVQARPLCHGARCGPVGISRTPARAHAFGHHVLGGLRPAGAHRRASGSRRPGRPLARPGRRAPRTKS